MEAANKISTDVVHNDIEFDEVMKIARRNDYQIQVIKHPTVIAEEKTESDTKKKREDIADELATINLKNAKRVYRTYPVTQGLAWAGAIIAVIVAILKIAETFKFWPYNK